MRRPKTFEEVCKSIDWKLLQEQKQELINLLPPRHTNWIEGLLSLIDEIQDSAVDYYGIPEKTVFGRRGK
jgi:hypothetical protein